MKVSVAQLCPTLCDPMDCSPPGSSVPGILQARILEWVAMPSSRGSSDPGIKSVSPGSPALGGGFFTTSATWEACGWLQDGTIGCRAPGAEPRFGAAEGDGAGGLGPDDRPSQEAWAVMAPPAQWKCGCHLASICNAANVLLSPTAGEEILETCSSSAKWTCSKLTVKVLYQGLCSHILLASYPLEDLWLVFPLKRHKRVVWSWWNYTGSGDNHTWTSSQGHDKGLILRITHLHFPTCDTTGKEKLLHRESMRYNLRCANPEPLLCWLPQLPLGVHSHWERESHSSVESGWKGPEMTGVCPEYWACGHGEGSLRGTFSGTSRI